MIRFNEFLKEADVTEEELDALIESLEFEDIAFMYDAEEFVTEALTGTERIRKAQQMRSRKTMLAVQRNTKLKRQAPNDILARRTKVSARKLVMKKLLKGRKKSELSASEKASIEARTTKMLSMMKNLPQKLLPKVRELDRQRIANKGKK
jgi:hypothetical protein